MVVYPGWSQETISAIVHLFLRTEHSRSQAEAVLWHHIHSEETDSGMMVGLWSMVVGSYVTCDAWNYRENNEQ